MDKSKNSNLLDIDELVIGFQNGQLENFDAIYTAMSGKRRGILKHLRHRLPATVTEHEIQALYDDSIIKAVDTYIPKRDATFYSYLSVLTESRRVDLVRNINAKKRDTEEPVIYLDSLEPMQLRDVMNKLETVDRHSILTGLESSDTYHLLLDYMHECQINSDYVVLILIESLDYTDVSDKYDLMRKLLRKDHSDIYLRRKLSRAKRDIQLYIKKLKKK